MPLSPINEIIEDLRQGKMIILMDDEARENEGDLIMAAEWVRPEDINFMARYGRGLICLTLTRERCQKLQLPLMVNETSDQHGTNFTVSIEAAQGVTTGISAADRAMTVRAAVATNAQPNDLVQPGHIFPVMAQSGGVLTRAGHTEAGCDLTRLAGLEPAAVIVEILNDDGSMARRPDLEDFAKKHGLKMGTIADLIDYRITNEKTVERVAQCHFPTEYGDFQLYAFRDTIEDIIHFALVKGQLQADQATLVRVHVTDDIADMMEVHRQGFPFPLGKAAKVIGEQAAGVIVILRKQESSRDIIKRIRQFQLEDEKNVNLLPELGTDLRTYGVGAQILCDLGLKYLRVIGAPKKMHALAGFGLEVTEYVAVD